MISEQNYIIEFILNIKKRHIINKFGRLRANYLGSFLYFK